MKLKPEVRWKEYPTELRAAADESLLVGYAAVFNTWSVDLGGFFERIVPGAFKKTLQERPDVRALLNHNPESVLGRTKNGTLQLAEDVRGLAVKLSPPDTSCGRDLVELVRRGDVDAMSFGFRVIQDMWDVIGEQLSRTLIEVELIEVSAVTFPAYPATELSARGYHWPSDTDLRCYVEAIGGDVTRVMGLVTPPAPAIVHAGRSVDMARRELILRGIK